MLKKKGSAINGVKPPHPLQQRMRGPALAQKLAKRLQKSGIQLVTLRKVDEQLTWMSTGHQALDDALSGDRDDAGDIIDGSGRGIPRGRIIEIFGRESSAKTALSLMVCAEAQRLGEVAAFIDIEHALDTRFATNYFGVDMGQLLWTQPDSGPEAMAQLHHMVKVGVSVIVVDSVAALVSKDELGGKIIPGEQARLMSSTCRRLTSALKQDGPIIIFLNQVRMKIGVLFGNPEFTSGGNALLFYSSIRLNTRKRKEIKKTGKIDGQPKVVATRIALRVVKNKVAAQGGYAEFDLSRKGVNFLNLTASKKKPKGKKKRKNAKPEDLDEDPLVSAEGGG